MSTVATRRLRTTTAHTRSFEQAPRVRAGDRVRFIRHDEQSPGWFWGASAEGVEGYFPTSWFRLDASETGATALYDYDAAELTIEAGVEVECLVRVAGWLRVRTASGDEGWIPSNTIEPRQLD